MATPLSVRIVELAHTLRETDPELSAWILSAQKATKPKRRRAMRKVTIKGMKRAGGFYCPANLIEKGKDENDRAD